MPPVKAVGTVTLKAIGAAKKAKKPKKIPHVVRAGFEAPRTYQMLKNASGMKIPLTYPHLVPGKMEQSTLDAIAALSDAKKSGASFFNLHDKPKGFTIGVNPTLSSELWANNPRVLAAIEKAEKSKSVRYKGDAVDFSKRKKNSLERFGPTEASYWNAPYGARAHKPNVKGPQEPPKLVQAFADREHPLAAGASFKGRAVGIVSGPEPKAGPFSSDYPAGDVKLSVGYRDAKPATYAHETGHDVRDNMGRFYDFNSEKGGGIPWHAAPEEMRADRLAVAAGALEGIRSRPTHVHAQMENEFREIMNLLLDAERGMPGHRVGFRTYAGADKNALSRKAYSDQLTEINNQMVGDGLAVSTDIGRGGVMPVQAHRRAEAGMRAQRMLDMARASQTSKDYKETAKALKPIFRDVLPGLRYGIPIAVGAGVAGEE